MDMRTPVVLLFLAAATLSAQDVAGAGTSGPSQPSVNLGLAGISNSGSGSLTTSVTTTGSGPGPSAVNNLSPHLPVVGAERLKPSAKSMPRGDHGTRQHRSGPDRKSGEPKNERAKNERVKVAAASKSAAANSEKSIHELPTCR